MDIRIVSNSKELAALQPHWERLEKQDPDLTFYSTFRFIRAWWDSFCGNPNYRLQAVCVYQNQDLVGIGPFTVVQRRKGPFTLRSLEFAGRGDYLNVLTDRSLNPLTIIKYIFKALAAAPSWDTIRLTNIPASCQLAAYLLKSEDNRYFLHQIENPFTNLTDYEDFPQFAKKNLPGKVVKLRNKLAREVGFQFEVVPGNRDGVFQKISQLHRLEKQFLVENMGRGERHSLYEDKFSSDFVQNLFTGTDNVLTFLYKDEEGNLLGYKTCYLYDRVALTWNGAYNPQYYQYSIGKIFYFDILRYLIENRLADRFDWGAGRYQWKFEWTSDFSATYKYEKALTKLGKGFLRARALFHGLKGK